MIDDDWTLDEGSILPQPWWRLPDHTRLTVRYAATSDLPGHPPTAYSSEFYGSLSVYGPRYVDLSAITAHDTASPLRHADPRRANFIQLITQFPGTFTTVINSSSSRTVWLALRLTRLSDPIADALAALPLPGIGSGR